MSASQWENCSSVLGENVPCSETTEVKAVDVALFMFACLLATFVCTGNLLAILSIWRTPSLRTLPNLYVASLAAADFVVGLGTVVLALFLLPAVRVQLFYRYINLCVLMHGTNLGMTAVSVLHMTLISIDRFLYINRPYVYERVVTVRLVIVCLTGIWIFGVFYSMVPQFTYKPYGVRPICDITMRLPIEYLFFTSASLYFSLASIIILMYSLILRTAFRQQNAVGANHVTQVQGTLLLLDYLSFPAKWIIHL